MPNKKKSELFKNCTTSDSDFECTFFIIDFLKVEKYKHPKKKLNTLLHMLRVTCHMSCITCHMSCITCNMSCITCHMSHVACHVSHGMRLMSHVTWHLILAVLSSSRSLIVGLSDCWYVYVCWYLLPRSCDSLTP